MIILVLSKSTNSRIFHYCSWRSPHTISVFSLNSFTLMKNSLPFGPLTCQNSFWPDKKCNPLFLWCNSAFCRNSILQSFLEYSTSQNSRHFFPHTSYSYKWSLRIMLEIPPLTDIPSLKWIPSLYICGISASFCDIKNACQILRCISIMQSEITSFSKGVFVEKVFSALGLWEWDFHLLLNKHSFLCQMFTHLLG